MDVIKIRCGERYGKGYAWEQGGTAIIIKASDREEALGTLLLELACHYVLSESGIDLEAEDTVPDEIVDEYASGQY